MLIAAMWAAINFFGNGDAVPGQPSPAPSGKVWSLEHQHWHDAAGLPVENLGHSATPPSEAQASTPQPTGPVPPGKEWSAEHGHWHDAPGHSLADTTQGGGP